jgi:hypothetical protein
LIGVIGPELAVMVSERREMVFESHSNVNSETHYFLSVFNCCSMIDVISYFAFSRIPYSV